MYDRRNICAARTRIGHRALRERRPPPRGTRGTVTAVACPHLSLSFPSTAGASSRSLAYAPFGAARGRVLRTCGPALFMADARPSSPSFPSPLTHPKAVGASPSPARCPGREMNESADLKRPGRRDCAARVCAFRVSGPTLLVMPGLVPGISLRQASSRVRGPMDGRDKPGHDERGAWCINMGTSRSGH